MKAIRRLCVIFPLLAIGRCDGFDAKDMFVSHVSSVAKGGAGKLRADLVSCMHCPMYFAFDAAPDLVVGIVAEHGLRPVAALPPEARQVEALVKRSASWWQLADTNGLDQIYWIQYAPRQPGLETAFRLLVVKGEGAYFITSGHFDPEHYGTGRA